MLERYWWIERDGKAVKQGKTRSYRRICALTDQAYRQGARLLYSYSEEERAGCLRELESSGNPTVILPG